MKVNESNRLGGKDMEIEGIITLITQAGFPVACCVVMWRYLTTVTTELRKSVDSNTRAIERLSDKIEREVGNNERNLG